MCHHQNITVLSSQLNHNAPTEQDRSWGIFNNPTEHSWYDVQAVTYRCYEQNRTRRARHQDRTAGYQTALYHVLESLLDYTHFGAISNRNTVQLTVPLVILFGDGRNTYNDRFGTYDHESAVPRISRTIQVGAEDEDDMPTLMEDEDDMPALIPR